MRDVVVIDLDEEEEADGREVGGDREVGGVGGAGGVDQADDEDEVVELTEAEAYSASREMRREQFVQEEMPGHFFRLHVGSSAVPGGGVGRGKKKNAAKGEGDVGVKFTKAVQREMRAMSEGNGALPLHASSAVLLAVDSGRLDLMRALFLPHEDTPYAGGAFAIDFKLPPEYPDKPPLAQLLTTGGGKVRFNPNLYANGKVCLSLLGTWSGPGWKPGTSTMLQVLVSIQALIFVPEPYYNEPGFEQHAGKCKTVTNKWHARLSQDYNFRTRLSTLRHALLPALRRPLGPVLAPFEKFLDGHYARRASIIEDQILGWQGEYAEYAAGDSGSKTGVCLTAGYTDAVMNVRAALAPFREAGRKLRGPPPVINLLDDDEDDDDDDDQDNAKRRDRDSRGGESEEALPAKRPRRHEHVEPT